MGQYKRSVGSILSAAVTALAVSTVASAETVTKPSTASVGDQPQVVSPYWNQPRPDQASAQAQAAPQIPQDPDQILAVTMQVVPQAAADAVVARWTYRRVESDLIRVTNNLRADFRDSAEYAAAVEDLKAAHTAYDSARTTALRDIKATGDYQAAVALRSNVSKTIANEHDQEQPDAQRLVSLAEMKLSYIAPMRSAEREALDGSPEVHSARERLLTAAQRVARMEKEFTHDARDSIELANLRKMHEDAKIAMLASATYLDQAAINREVAYDYALYTRRLDRYAPRVADGCGYGGGYGGYGVGYTGFGTFGGIGSVVTSGPATGYTGYGSPGGVNANYPHSATGFGSPGGVRANFPGAGSVRPSVK